MGENCNEFASDIFPLFAGFKDSLIVFCDIQSSPHVYIYNSNSLELLSVFGHEGKGPNDLNQPVFWGQFENTNSIKAWFYEPNLLRFSLFNISEILAGGSALPERQFFLPPEIGVAVNVLSIDEKTILAAGKINQGEFIICDIVSEKVSYKPFLIDFDESFHDELIKSDFIDSYKHSIFKIKPDGTKIVNAHGYLPIIDVYDPKGELIFSIIKDKQFRKPNIDLQNRQFDSSAKVYYLNTFLTDKYIYALNQNCTLAELNSGENNKAKIEVFTWSGQPVAEYFLNESVGPMAPFLVDESRRRIYTVNPKNPYDYYTVFKVETLN